MSDGKADKAPAVQAVRKKKPKPEPKKKVRKSVKLEEEDEEDVDKQLEIGKIIDGVIEKEDIGVVVADLYPKCPVCDIDPVPLKVKCRCGGHRSRLSIMPHCANGCYWWPYSFLTYTKAEALANGWIAETEDEHSHDHKGRRVLKCGWRVYAEATRRSVMEKVRGLGDAIADLEQMVDAIDAGPKSRRKLDALKLKWKRAPPAVGLLD